MLDSFAGYQTMRLNPLDSKKLSLDESEVQLSSYRRFRVLHAEKSFSLKFNRFVPDNIELLLS